jgi:hypothetical protein
MFAASDTYRAWRNGTGSEADAAAAQAHLIAVTG